MHSVTRSIRDPGDAKHFINCQSANGDRWTIVSSPPQQQDTAKGHEKPHEKEQQEFWPAHRMKETPRLARSFGQNVDRGRVHSAGQWVSIQLTTESTTGKIRSCQATASASENACGVCFSDSKSVKTRPSTLNAFSKIGARA